LLEAGSVVEGQVNPDNEATLLGIAAVIRAHRDPSFIGLDPLDYERQTAQLGGRVAGPLLLAMALTNERAGRPAEALVLLMWGLAESEEVTVAADVLADAARLAVALGDQTATQAVLDYVEPIMRASAESWLENVAMHCAGLVARDPVRLLEAARRYAEAGRPLPRAQALEAAATALAEAGDAAGARAHLDEARDLYAALGAEWDLARTASPSRQ